MGKNRLIETIFCNHLCDFREQEGEEGQVCCHVCDFKKVCIGECIQNPEECKMSSKIKMLEE